VWFLIALLWLGVAGWVIDKLGTLGKEGKLSQAPRIALQAAVVVVWLMGLGLLRELRVILVEAVRS
jgi:hypothetical protein